MATAKARIGLSKIELGPIANDGGMGTVLTEFGATVSETAVIQNEDPTVTDFPIEEQTAPFASVSVDGKTTMTWSSYNVEPASLVLVKGGTTTTDASGTRWNAPLETPNIELSVRATMKDGTIFEIIRGKVNAKLVWNLQKTKLVQIDFTVTALQPEKDGLAPYGFKNPA